MTTISIAMATYNGERFIREQLDSLAAQTYPPSELVVTDDGSTDSTLDVIADFSRTAPFRVHVYRNGTRLNYRENFMKSANLCSGDLIAFCDQDDVWDRDKLATLVPQFKKAEIDLVFHDFRLIDADGNLIVNQDSNLCPSSVDPWTSIRGLTVAFRRKLLKYSELWGWSVDQFKPTERLAHDQWFIFLAHSFNSLHHISRPLLSYRQHGANLYGVPCNSIAVDAGLPGNLKVLTNALFGQRQLAQTKRNFLQQHLLGPGLASMSRVKVLEEIYQRDKSTSEPRLQKQIALYKMLGHSYIPRASIYEQRRITGRFWAFSKALIGGSYSSNARGLKDATLDILYGIFVKPSEEVGITITRNEFGSRSPWTCV